VWFAFRGTLIGGDAKTGAKILERSPQTFMRYVRANDETARSAIEEMVEGLPLAGAPLDVLQPPLRFAPFLAVSGGLTFGSGDLIRVVSSISHRNGRRLSPSMIRPASDALTFRLTTPFRSVRFH
jgi:hypothetical protein